MTTQEPATRIKITPAAERLGISRRQLDNLIARGLFTVQQDVPDGDRFLLGDEVDFFIRAVGSPEERDAKQRHYVASKKANRN